MILIDDILISEEVIEESFICNLNACKGACCIEGDYGAPLTNNEVKQIDKILHKIKPYLPSESHKKIVASGFHQKNIEATGEETALMEDGACVFMGRNELGITYCGIEKAYNEGQIKFKKPISCHLYPIRVVKNEHTGFQALNYDRWDICSAACSLGNKMRVKVYEFTKDALVRAYGQDFYDQLDHAAKDLKQD